MSTAAPKQPDPLDAMIEELASLQPTHDPLQEWLAANRAVLAPLVGQRAAIDPARGLLAASPTLEGLHRALEAAGLMDDESVVIVTVR